MMMDQGEIEFSRKVIEESVNVIIDTRFVGESSFEGSKPLTIFFKDDPILVANMTMHSPKLTVGVPSSFPCTGNKMVPWSYNCNCVNESSVANISGIGGMTRNERCNMPATVEIASPKPVKELPKQKNT